MQTAETPNELKACQERISRIWLDMGRAHYEIELLQKHLSELSIKAHNVNQDALKLNEKIQKEKKEMEIKLAPAPPAS